MCDVLQSSGFGRSFGGEEDDGDRIQCWDAESKDPGGSTKSISERNVG